MAKKYCTHCGYTNEPVHVTKGHLLIEIILWCMYLLPGMIYTVWRKATMYWACPVCAGNELIPPDSPRAMKMKGC
jgi:rubredoxin